MWTSSVTSLHKSAKPALPPAGIYRNFPGSRPHGIRAHTRWEGCTPPSCPPKGCFISSQQNICPAESTAPASCPQASPGTFAPPSWAALCWGSHNVWFVQWQKYANKWQLWTRALEAISLTNALLSSPVRLVCKGLNLFLSTTKHRLTKRNICIATTQLKKVFLPNPYWYLLWLKKYSHSFLK